MGLTETSGSAFDINRRMWNERTKVHVGSAFYGVEEFVAGKDVLTPIELPLLGDLKGKDVLHLQCHFGQDTLCLARMGANITGIDISDEAITEAQKLAERVGLKGTFIRANVYDTPASLNNGFDMVFTTFGTIGWLPDLDKWAAVIARTLRPGGRLVFADFHPAMWMFDDNFTHVRYSYFNTEEIVEESDVTYADRYAKISVKGVSWNHPFGEVITALLNAGLQLTHFSEYDYSPYGCFPTGVEVEPGKWMLPGMERKLPMVYALTAVKPVK